MVDPSVRRRISSSRSRSRDAFINMIREASAEDARNTLDDFVRSAITSIEPLDRFRMDSHGYTLVTPVPRGPGAEGRALSVIQALIAIANHITERRRRSSP